MSKPKYSPLGQGLPVSEPLTGFSPRPGSGLIAASTRVGKTPRIAPAGKLPKLRKPPKLPKAKIPKSVTN